MAASIGIYPLGVGSSGATVLWHTTFLLLVDDRSYVIDCPRNLFKMLAFNEEHGSLSVGMDAYQHILLTHLHFDHAEGLVELAHSGRVSADQPLHLYAPRQTLAYLWSHRVERGVVSAAQIEGGPATLDRYFRRHPLDNPHDFGRFKLHYRQTQHIPYTVAYRFDFGEYQLGYSADTAYDESLIAWLDQCDTVIHDVLLPPWSEHESVQRLHAPLAKLLELPASFQEKTFLCHYDEDTYLEQEIGGYRYLRQNTLYALKP